MAHVFVVEWNLKLFVRAQIFFGCIKHDLDKTKKARVIKLKTDLLLIFFLANAPQNQNRKFDS